MRYMGGKAKHAKAIAHYINNNRASGQLYVEPFVGGANVFYLPEYPKLGADINEYIISMYWALQQGWEPPDYVTETEYKNIQSNKDIYPMHLVGFVGAGGSYAGKWFGGYARSGEFDAKKRNYIKEAKNDLIKNLHRIKSAMFLCSSYENLSFPDDSVVYCDPPYKDRTDYGRDFDHVAFWQWCREKTDSGATLFVSEYEHPEDFVPIWQKEVYSSLDKDRGSKSDIEKLVVHESIVKRLRL